MASKKSVNLIRKAYKTGYADGQAERQKFFNTLRTTNFRLWQELCRLDVNEPSEGIWLSVAFAEKLAAALQKKHSGHARELRKKIKRSNQKLDKLLEILEGCREFK